MENLIELHLHLDGALSIDNCRKLANIQGLNIPESDVEIGGMMMVGPNCCSLDEFLTKFDFAVSLLQTYEGIKNAVKNLLDELKEQGVIYVEIRFAPQLHTAKGLDQDEVVKSAIEGVKLGGIRSNLILCCVRGSNNHAENLETVRVAKKYLGYGVCAIDLAGAEGLYKTKNFEDVFICAKELGVPFTIHAGEADGPDSVYEAIRLGARRIGHGIRAIEDPKLVEMIAKRGITLEICPTSNVCTAVCKKIEELPIVELMSKGVNITINTDDPMVCNTKLERELELVKAAFDLSNADIAQLQINAAEASFADAITKKELLKKIKDEVVLWGVL